MNTDTLKAWLLNQGGSAVRLNLGAMQGEIDSETVTALCDIPQVQTRLGYLDGFATPERDKKTLEHLIHYYKPSCIENFFPLLMDLGFKAGIPALDERMAYVEKVYQDMLVCDAPHCFYFPLMLNPFIFIAGYTYPDVVAAMLQRLSKLHIAAEARTFDIYQDKGKLPKVPERWADRGVLKDALNPFSAEADSPLPTIYDLKALAYLPDSIKTPEIQAQIDAIITYILDPRFQQFPEGYGLLWVPDRRTFHACGWSPTLPVYEDFERPKSLGSQALLAYVEIMSHFEVARTSVWYQDALAYLEQFRTERGTYAFPKDHLNRKYIEAAFLNDSNLALKRNARRDVLNEVVSTLRMVHVLSRL